MPHVVLSEANSAAETPDSNLIRSTRSSQVLGRLALAVRAALLRARAGGSWGALVVRLCAVGLALLGLAGIGAAAGRAPELKEITRAPVALGLAQLSNAAAAPELAHLGGRENAPELSAAGSSAPHCTCPAPSSTGAAPVEPVPLAAAPSGDAAVPVAAPASPARATAQGKAGPVLLNSADANELARLPSVGPKRALAILELRRRLGRFRRPSDLLRVKGIGPKLLARMLPQLVLDAPPPSAGSVAPEARH